MHSSTRRSQAKEVYQYKSHTKRITKFQKNNSLNTVISPLTCNSSHFRSNKTTQYLSAKHWFNKLSLFRNDCLSSNAIRLFDQLIESENPGAQRPSSDHYLNGCIIVDRIEFKVPLILVELRFQVLFLKREWRFSTNSIYLTVTKRLAYSGHLFAVVPVPQFELSVAIQIEQTADEHSQSTDVHRFEQLFLERFSLIG